MKTVIRKLVATFVFATLLSDPKVRLYAANPAAIPFSQIGAVAGKLYSGDGLAIAPGPEGARLHCVFQRLDAQATAGGLWLTSTAKGARGESFRVVARTVGTGALPLTGRVETGPKSARFIRPGLTEEYSVGVDGIQQDFVILQRPSGASPVRLELEVDGAKAEAMAGGARLVLSDGGRKLDYTRLKAGDARGRELAVRLEVLSASRLAVVLDDAAAEYPVRIDPTFSDANWISLGGVAGADAAVETAVTDSRGNLYIGGIFETAGHAGGLNGIAEWNGSEWSALGSGMDDTVDILLASGTNLYAAGSFTTAGGVPASCIAEWNGSSWSALGGGLSGGYIFTYVKALTMSANGILYAGGNFTLADGNTANYIAQWNGSSWAQVGQGMNEEVDALASSGNTVYVAGSFTTAINAKGTVVPASYIAQWNGLWSPLGQGVSYGVNALVVSGTNLYVGGNFQTATDSDGTAVTVNYVADWNGSSWSALGSGMDNTIIALAMSGTNLYAGGYFDTAGGNPASSIAEWNGSAWSPVGLGTGAGPDGANQVNALAVAGTNVFAAGHFGSAGGIPAVDLAQWNGNSWSVLDSAPGLGNNVSALAILNGTLYAGGDFVSAGSGSANYIAQWNGNSWSPVGSGMNGQVYALAVSGTNLYAGGSFTTAGGVPASYVAQWNGNTWSALGSGLSGQPDFLDFPPVFPGVMALATTGANLYAGGFFTTAGGAPAGCIAQWNGSGWSALGAGISGPVDPEMPPPEVMALAGSDTNLYAGGYFTTAGGVTANYVAEWNGSAWSALGGGVDYEVDALAMLGTNLVAGGGFTAAAGDDGVTVPVNYIAEWNGSAWSPLGAGMDSGVACLLVSDGTLYAGGDFTMAGNVPASSIATWDGSNWSALGSGLNNNVSALAVSGTSLFAGGDFTTAGTNGSAYAAQAILAPPSLVTTNKNFGFTGGTRQFSFDVCAGPLQTVVIQASTDLQNWVPLQTNLLGSPQIYFSDPSAAGFPRRFYRTLQVP